MAKGPNSGNPAYQVGRPVIVGVVNTLENGTVIQRTPVNLWKPVSIGLCDSAEMRPVLFGENCYLFQINFTEYDFDRNDVCWPQLVSPSADITRVSRIVFGQGPYPGVFPSSLPPFSGLHGNRSEQPWRSAFL
ncbi:hypothetical protein J4Q44_G00165650 [Coregonus suidteri]|uniref:Uncharacterized protein n=1 Tax=Coregonus suidteri TaxID=861788 RepID=A0AAN8QWB8_9TELE